MSAFLIKYHRSSGKVEVNQYDSLVEATRQRLMEDRLNQDPDLEIVAVGSRDEESLRSSHSRYFSGV